jgi:hypothetical protein
MHRIMYGSKGQHRSQCGRALRFGNNSCNMGKLEIVDGRAKQNYSGLGDYDTCGDRK